MRYAPGVHNARLTFTIRPAGGKGRDEFDRAVLRAERHYGFTFRSEEELADAMASIQQELVIELRRYTPPMLVA